MLPLILLSLLSTAFPPTLASPPCSNAVSCSPASESEDACCVPSPHGLFVLRQRFEPDVGGDAGNWGIDGLDVLQCQTQQPASNPYAARYSQEEIGSLCYRSPLLHEEKMAAAESEWAQSEVGEGVEEIWERSWNSAGRFISTLGDNCMSKEEQVPMFFNTLSGLHNLLQTAKWLADADISPSEDTSYSLSELTTALSQYEMQPVLMCNNATLDSVHWPFWTKGPFHTGEFVPATLAQVSNCPSDGIVYPPTTSRPIATATHTWDPVYRPSPRPITLSHDESKQYPYPPDSEPTAAFVDQKGKLKFFQGRDEDRESGKENYLDKQWARDEL